MKYTLNFNRTAEKRIGVHIETHSPGGPVRFHLPLWRPGRYTRQEYARNVADVVARGGGGQPLPLTKVAANTWEVAAPAGPVSLSYTYFADQLDAGGVYLDDAHIYVNGICLFMYREELIDEACELLLELPETYRLAGISGEPGDALHLASFHELVDSPFFAGEQLIHHAFEQEGIAFHIWFMGECMPDLPRMEADFRRYTAAQLALFGDFPVNEYHYLVIMRPAHYRHGVEHQRSTVISIGPGYELMQPGFYRSFLEICSHELFHTWNVKALRPVDMFPYRYGEPNYSRLHYVTEGITTYYGDLMIWKGGGWSLDQWLQSLNGELRAHHQMGGKDFTSLEAASFDSWVNGYGAEGAPNRRISFYTKGYLVSFLLDFFIRKASGNRASLDDVLYRMYHEIAKAGRAYTKLDYKTFIEAESGADASDFFEKYISGTEPLEPLLAEAAAYFGFQLDRVRPDSLAESLLGIKTQVNGSVTGIENLLPGSPALLAGLSKGDELLSVESLRIDRNLEELLYYFRERSELHIHYFRLNRLHETRVRPGTGFSPFLPRFVQLASPSEAQLANRQAWQTVHAAARISEKR